MTGDRIGGCSIGHPGIQLSSHGGQRRRSSVARPPGQTHDLAAMRDGHISGCIAPHGKEGFFYYA
jgi:hypothetical protein